MPKHCEQCKFYSKDDAATACPTCQTPLRFTFLPPAGEAAAPLANAPQPGAAPKPLRPNQRQGFWDSLGFSPKILAGVGSVLLAIGGFAVRYQLAVQRAEARADAVQPGMHISEAARILDSGRARNVPGSVRFRDRFSPDDDSDGEYTLEENGTKTVVKWENGFVTSVEQGERPGSGGMRRPRTTMEE